MEYARAVRLWVLLVIVAMASKCIAVAPSERGGSYLKQDTYKDQGFLDKFDFLDSSAPKDGHVVYLNRHSAQKAGVAQAQDGNIFLGVDASSVTRGARRKSVRLSSKAIYNSGLFVLSLGHMPTGCGTWPSFWLKGNGASWPKHGGINIIEGVHSMTQVKTTLHTTAGCDQSSVQSHVDFSGDWERGSTKLEANDCSLGAPGQWKGQGCEQKGPVGSMGKPFNDGGGGTFVAEWSPTSGHIRSWFFRGTALPSDLVDGNPDPESWGKPYSFFRLSEDTCSRHHFVNMSVVFDLNLCGSYGDALFQLMCPSEARMSGSCNEYVSDHPKVMQHAYWSIRSLEVYQRTTVQRSQTTNYGLGTMLDASRTRSPQTTSTLVPTTTQVTTPAASEPAIVVVASQNPHTLTTSSSPPPVAILGAAMRKAVAAKAAPLKALAAESPSVTPSVQETSNYLDDAVLEEKEGSSFLSGLLHFFQPAVRTNVATNLAGGVAAMKGAGAIERTVTGSAVVDARTVKRTVESGPPPLQVKKIDPSATFIFCSAAIALGIFAFWAKIGRLTSAFARHEGQLVSASQENAPSLRDEMSSRLSMSSANVSGSCDMNPTHDGGDTCALRVLPPSARRPATASTTLDGKGGYPDREIHPSEHCPLGRSNGDTQPALMDFLDSDGGEDFPLGRSSDGGEDA